MSEPAVLLSVADGVASVELNRPAASNALDMATAEQLHATVEALAGDDAVRVVVLSGRGRRFCAGGDVRSMALAPDRGRFLGELAGAAHRAVLALHELDKPVVAVVQGAAAGAGLALTLAADVVVAGESARFLTAYAGVGLTPDCGTSWLLPAMIGQRRALELALTGRVLTAAEALDWGLITLACPDAELASVSAGLAATLAAGPAPALGLTRRLLRDGPGHSLREHLDLEAQTIARAADSAESRARVDAFTA